MIRTLALLCLVACGVGLGVEATALAATVHLRAPDECAQEDEIVAEVDSLIGRPLSEIPRMKFEVEIARENRGRFRLRLDTTEGEDTRTREVAGDSCTELANVASVAIAMTIRASAASRERSPSGRTESESAPVAPPRKPQRASAEAKAEGESALVWRGSSRSLPSPMRARFPRPHRAARWRSRSTWAVSASSAWRRSSRRSARTSLSAGVSSSSRSAGPSAAGDER
jgi:hypothetical protein